MRSTKLFASLVMVGGMAVLSTASASAQDWRNLFNHQQNSQSVYNNRGYQDNNRGYVDNSRYQNNYRFDRASQLRAEVARDRAELAEDTRRGRWNEVRRDRAELARDLRELASYDHNDRNWR